MEQVCPGDSDQDIRSNKSFVRVCTRVQGSQDSEEGKHDHEMRVDQVEFHSLKEVARFYFVCFDETRDVHNHTFQNMSFLRASRVFSDLS